LRSALLTLLVVGTMAAPAAAQRSGSGARAELTQSLVQRYPLTEIGPSVLGLRGGEDSIRRAGPTFLVRRPGLVTSTQRRPATVNQIRGEAAEAPEAVNAQPVSPGDRFYVNSIYVGSDVVEVGLVSVQSVAGAGGSARLWMLAVFFFPPDVLERGDRTAVYSQIDAWLAQEGAVPAAATPAAGAAASPPAPPGRAQRMRIEAGMTREELVRMLGEASREVSFGQRAWMSYAGFVVALEDDRVKSVETNGRPARVRVRTEPEGAEIFLGENLVGHGPSTLELPAGRYVFIVRRNGYTPWRQEVDVLSGSDISLIAQLQRSEP
jgi:hypothetical protein